VVVATDAQATGYLLKRPTVSLVESEYSVEVWDEQRVHELMRTYDADFVVLYPRADASLVPVQRESAFLDRVLRGQLPDWLEVLAHLSPLWHAVELARDLSLGQPNADDLVQTAVLVALTIPGLWLADRCYRRRLVV